MAGCRPLSEAEIFQTIDAFRCRRDKTLFVLGVRTGFRISELLKLEVKDVYRNGAVLDQVKVARRFLKEKKGSSRTIPLHPQAKAMIESHVRAMERPEGPLFPSNRGTFLTRFTAHKIFKDAFKKAGLTGALATHSMRKTFAKKVYGALGNDLVALQQALGHAHINTTIDYVSVDQKAIDRAILE